MDQTKASYWTNHPYGHDPSCGDQHRNSCYDCDAADRREETGVSRRWAVLNENFDASWEHAFDYPFEIREVLERQQPSVISARSALSRFPRAQFPSLLAGRLSRCT